NALSPAMLGVYHTDHAQVMLGAGLLREADEDLDVAVTLFRQTGDRHNQADAELARAHVALAEDRWSDARYYAQCAARHFAARGAPGWVLLARYAAVAANVGERRHLSAAAASASRLAGEFDAAGLDDEARPAA